MVFRTDDSIANAIRAIDILVPKIISTMQNVTNFSIVSNSSLLESRMIQFVNMSTTKNMTFPEMKSEMNETVQVVIPTELFENSTESPIRVSSYCKSNCLNYRKQEISTRHFILCNIMYTICISGDYNCHSC